MTCPLPWAGCPASLQWQTQAGQQWWWQAGRPNGEAFRRAMSSPKSVSHSGAWLSAPTKLGARQPTGIAGQTKGRFTAQFPNSRAHRCPPQLPTQDTGTSCPGQKRSTCSPAVPCRGGAPCSGHSWHTDKHDAPLHPTPQKKQSKKKINWDISYVSFLRPLIAACRKTWIIKWENCHSAQLLLGLKFKKRKKWPFWRQKNWQALNLYSTLLSFPLLRENLLPHVTKQLCLKSISHPNEWWFISGEGTLSQSDPVRARECHWVSSINSNSVRS